MSFHTITQLSKDGENHESTLANLHCSAIKNINWRALSQSQRRNFPSHLITEKISHYLLFWNELHTFDSLTCKPCNGTIKAILISNQLKQINKMHYPQNCLHHFTWYHELKIFPIAFSRCTICTGVTQGLHCSQPIRIEYFFMYIINQGILVLSSFGINFVEQSSLNK